MTKQNSYLVAIDVGSSKVAVLIGHRDEDGGVEVVGKGVAPNRGTRKGNIVNVEVSVEALRQATEEAEVMAGVEISRAYVGVASTDVRSINSRGMVSVARKDREISRQDIERVLEAAQSAALPSDRDILHAIPQEFIVDEQGGIADPLGMLGTRLEVAVHLVTGNVTRRRTLLTCINRAGIEVTEMVFEPLATAEAVLTHDERELGALVLDIGDGTSEYALFSEGEVQHSAVLPIGARNFTNDLAMVLRTPFAEAERIKIKNGCCLADLVAEGVGGTVSSRIRETVKAVEAIIQEKSRSVKIAVDLVNNDAVSAKLIEVAQHLNLDKSTASRRVREAIEKGFLENRETRPGRPMRLVLGDPLPEAVEVLPHPDRLRGDD